MVGPLLPGPSSGVGTVGSPEPALTLALSSTVFFQLYPDEPGLISLFPMLELLASPTNIREFVV